MKKILFILLISINIFGWELKGTPQDINISQDDGIIWAYQDGVWKTNVYTDEYPKLQTLYGGEAFWVYNDFSYDFTDTHDSHKWTEGWNFVSPVFENWNLKDKFKGNATVIWTYKNNEWYLYSDYYKYVNTFDTLNVGEGAWVYVPNIYIKMNNTPIFCSDGNCSELITDNTDYKIYLKTNAYNTDLKFAFDLYRYSNDTHYKLAIGPFQINQNGVTTQNIPVYVVKEGVGGSGQTVDNTKDTFITYENGYIMIDSQKIASLFDKTIPDTKEKFLMKMYISGFSVPGFKPDEDFGTLGIENFGTWVTVTNDESVEFEMEIK